MSTNYVDETPTDSTEVAIDARLELPKKKYQLRCIECEFKIGSAPKNTPYLQRTLEVVSPSSVTIGEKSYNIAGLKIRFDNVYLTAKNGARVKADSKRFGVDIPDNETPNTQAYIGKLVDAILTTDVVKEVDEETKEPITDSDGKPIVKYYHRIQEYI